MARCFVIQPIDKGPFDKRYTDVLVPAIKAADLDAYRVDEDPLTTIPIEDIENGIRASEICLADITTDNPNIWYEVGFAFANGKPVVMICKTPRPTNTPFDIQHRQITYYESESPSDFGKLQAEITDRLKGKIKKAEALQTIASLSPLKTTKGLSPYEIAAMVTIMEDRLTPESGVSPWELQQAMRTAGFTNIAASISLESLKIKGMIRYDEEVMDRHGNTSMVCKLTDAGLDWMLDNQDRFTLSTQGLPVTEDEPEVADEDVPF